MFKIKEVRKYASIFAAITVLASCSSDDDSITEETPIDIPNDDAEVILPVEGNPAIADLEMVFNRFLLEDRTDSDGAVNPSGINNGYAQMLRASEDGEHYIGFTDFNNVDEVIDFQHPTITASRFALFLTTVGAGLGVQNGFDEGDLPIYIGELEMNGESVVRLIPAEGNGGEINVGGVTINTRNTADILLTATGDIAPQRSTGSRNSWYDWVVLHPFQGDNLRPVGYPSIVADLDADHQLPQNFEMTFNEFTLEDRTEGGTESGVSISGIDNGTASIVSYDDQTFIRLSDFNNIDQGIDRNPRGIISTEYAVFLTTAGAGLGAQNDFDAGDLPVYIGTLSSNGFLDIALTPAAENADGSVTFTGANGDITVNTNANMQVDANGFITEQLLTGDSGVFYDWIVLHPFQGEVLRPITYPGIVADLDGANELAQNQN